MADKTIDSLPRATVIGDTDLLVLQQGQYAKSVTGETLIEQLLEIVNDHGGVKNITFTESAGNIYMVITARDDTTWTSPNIKGQKGDTESPVATMYAPSSSGTTPPSTGWVSTPPIVSSGEYLWQRIRWSDGTFTYLTARQGQEGQGGGDVLSVNGKTGLVVLTAADVGALSETEIGIPFGIAQLDENGKIPISQFPVWDESYHYVEE